MALTPAQTLTAMLCLGLPTRTDVTFQFSGDRQKLRNAEIALQALKEMDAAQEAMAIEIVTGYKASQMDTDAIKTKDLTSSAGRDRANFRRLLADTIGFTLPLGGSTSIGRA